MSAGLLLCLVTFAVPLFQKLSFSCELQNNEGNNISEYFFPIIQVQPFGRVVCEHSPSDAERQLKSSRVNWP